MSGQTGAGAISENEGLRQKVSGRMERGSKEMRYYMTRGRERERGQGDTKGEKEREEREIQG